jgi:hypothetical protein
MPRPEHSDAFLALRDAILARDDDRDRARLAGLFCHMTAPQQNLGALRDTLRAIAALDDADLDRLAQWSSSWMNAWGQTPRASGLRIDPHARRDPAERTQ